MDHEEFNQTRFYYRPIRVWNNLPNQTRFFITDQSELGITYPIKLHQFLQVSIGRVHEKWSRDVWSISSELRPDVAYILYTLNRCGAVVKSVEHISTNL